MLKLEATLIATTAAWSRPDGWAPDRGVDFIVRAATRQAIIAAPAEVGRTVASEPASFLDADDVRAHGVVVRRYVSLAAQAAEAAAVEPAERPLTRAWSSVARKVPGS
jgi:hypothetical protein